ncbi:O-methyltransferase [Mycobacterium tuberculosis]|uniref:O-methyltransferase n=1 Tax=Mycobacterium tuberculosis TaxID=1773 RepID=A0A916LFL6_MYCTX|nr:O-methyltransferase [Mycobacterium tuberculosis]
MVTLEYQPKHAEVARVNLQRAGVADRVEVVVGPALDTLPTLAGGPPGLDATAIQTVGRKGWDGFALALVR